VERQQRIETLFAGALQQPVAQREVWLRQVCGSDRDVLGEVAALLAHHRDEEPESWAAAAAAQSIAAPGSLKPGQFQGPYRIDSFVAEGGMGQVYRATDTRLNRAVAVKICAGPFSERFAQEAKLIASLNHPNICHLYDVGPNYLVMEFVEGTPLRGPLPLKQAVEYAGQILDALDTAHRKGITHRDLKPANILVTKQGVKLLDFGLAKRGGPLRETDATVTEALTGKGEILGTLQYMSPEQLQAKEADVRSDLFSFGCVLYEMFSGKRAFEGQSAASVIAAILEREPAPLNFAPPLERVIRTCLTKEPDQRFQNALDLKRALTWALEQPIVVARVNRWGWIAIAGVMLALAALGGVWAVTNLRQPPADERVLRVQIDPPAGGQFVLGGVGGISISPDGKNAAYVAVVNGKTGLWVRPLDGVVARLLPGTENAIFPFWSPDSKSIAFIIGVDKLYRIDVRGGAPVEICDTGQIFTGGSWGDDGYILFSTLTSDLLRLPASGGRTSRVISPDASRGEVFFRWPQVLGGGRFLFWVEGSKPENTGVYATSVARPGERVKPLSTETNAIYAPGIDGRGHLLWLHGGALVAQEFDPRTLQFAGEPQTIAEALSPSTRRQMHVAASANGLLLYGSSGASTQLAWFDRTGKLLRQIGEPVEAILSFRLSPDDRQVAVHRSNVGVWDLWLMDAERGLANRFTTGPGQHHHPVWSPNGEMILYSQISSNSVLRKAANGTDNEQSVAQRPTVGFAIDDWSADSRWLLAREVDPATKRDLWIIPITPDGKLREDEVIRPYLRTSFNEAEGRFSPEPSPRWVAYQSDESGRDEVYVDSFPRPRGKKRISTGGGRFPEWGHGGRELFYLAPDDRLMTVSLKVGSSSIEPSPPRELFRLPVTTTDFGGGYEVTRDGQRFLMRTNPEGRPQSLTLIANWPALLRRGVRAR
jgi:Tol biopolymer transport system component/predicted Ser/Thr protein kinase